MNESLVFVAQHILIDFNEWQGTVIAPLDFSIKLYPPLCIECSVKETLHCEQTVSFCNLRACLYGASFPFRL